MNQPQALEISREALSLLEAPSYSLSVLADGKDAFCSDCSVLPILGAHSFLMLAIANQAPVASLLHVGDACNVAIPHKFDQKIEFLSKNCIDRASNGTLYCATQTRVLICATIRASIPCGDHSIFLADVTEAKFIR